MASNAIEAIIARRNSQVEAEADGFRVAAACCSVAFSRVSRQLFDAGAVLKSPETKRESLEGALKMIEDPSLVILIRVDDQPEGFLVLDPLLVNALIELATGAGERQVYRERRAPTMIDAALSRGFCESFLASLPGEQAALHDSLTLPRLQYHGFETDPDRLPFVLTEGEYGLVSGNLEFQSGARGGALTLALPLGLWSGAGPVHVDPTSDWSRRMNAVVAHAPMKLRAVLEHLQMPLGEAGALRPGDVLPIAAASISGITLEDVKGETVLTGRLGQIAGRKAVAITGATLPGLLSPGVAARVPTSRPDLPMPDPPLELPDQFALDPQAVEGASARQPPDFTPENMDNQSSSPPPQPISPA